MRVVNQSTTIGNFKISLTTIKRTFFVGLFVLVFNSFGATSASAQSTDVYITPDGGGNGVCTNNTHPPNWFNNSANWGNGSSQIGAGTVVHLCGTFNGSEGTTLLSAQGGGSSGRPVTILFENGTTLQSPAFTAAIDITTRQYLTVDGGTNGVIKNTANGTSLSLQRSQSTGVSASDCTPGCRITNLSIMDLYVRNSNDPLNGIDQTSIDAVSFLRAPGIRVDHNIVTNCGWCLSGFGSGMEIDHNDISKMDHGVASGCGGTCTNETVHDNHFHDMGQWDTTNNAYHHDGIHFFSEGGSAQGPLIYNNLFDGNLGVNTTAWIFIEGVSGGLGVHGAVIFNNVLLDSVNSAKIMLWMEGHGSSSNNSAFNNYFYNGNGMGMGMFVRGETNFSAKNNIVGIISYQGTSIVSGGVDNNIYYDSNADFGNNNLFGWNSSTVSSITTWRTLCGCDGAGKLATAAIINVANVGIIAAPSNAIGAGANLSYLGIPALNSDKNGNPRAKNGPWDAGAYNSGSSSAIIPPPTALKAIVN